VKACEPYENKSNSASSYGTAAHALAELCLLGKLNEPDDMLGKEIEGVIVDKEMVEGVQEYLDYVLSYKGQYSIAETEVRLDFSHVVPEGFGTADTILIIGKTLHVIDLKFGHNIVYAENNTQLQLYGIGALSTYEFMIDDIEEVVLHIVQPRANHFDKWITTPDHLAEWSDWVRERAKLALSKDAPFNPTKKGCEWCLHRFDCIALFNHVNDIITGEFNQLEEIDGQVDKISNEHIKRILDNMDLISGFLKSVSQVALERAQSGDKIEGYKIVESTKHKAWANEALALKVLKDKGKTDDEIFTKKMITPTQALKLIGKKDADDLNSTWITPHGDPVLVSESDKRPEINAICENFDTL
jgi:hypothetical protein